MILPDYFDIRYSEMDDLAFLKKYFDEPGACDDFPFDREEKDAALQNWIGFSKYKASLTGIIDGKVCAVGTLFLMPYRKVAHHCSFYIVVDKAYRKKGIGTSIVKNLLNLAKTKFKLESVHVEIYDDSHLLSVLKMLRFEEFVRQENFVKIGDQSRARLLLEHCFI